MMPDIITVMMMVVVHIHAPFLSSLDIIIKNAAFFRSNFRAPFSKTTDLKYRLVLQKRDAKVSTH